eukprot:TRINITY_DN11740_c0_g1_i1.p1 TRINITY_DN11740_c0_g1~~TRINITY_DN11740_c0_g1_i1.p1  ORF type:complete len:299 (-),score=26.95 TRINITY_DN11740_c0_g1_i1:38-862(-)
MEFALVTGSSRGLGREIAIQFARRRNDLGIPVHLVLISRTEEALKEVQQIITSRKDVVNNVDILAADLSDLDGLEVALIAVFSKIDKTRVQRAYLFNNAGSMRYPLNGRDMTDHRLIRKSIDENFTSVAIITSLFLRNFRPGEENPSVRQSYIVNISSGAAAMPFATWSLYCAEKSAREMYHMVIGKEEEESKVKTLNYRPGMVHTQMQDTFQEVSENQSSTKAFLAKVLKEGQMLTPTQSIDVLFQVLEKNDYESGSHVDVYTVKPEYFPKLS